MAAPQNDPGSPRKRMKSRIMQQADLATVYSIEQQANAFPWTYKNFEDCLGTNYPAFVFLDESDDILGYTILQTVVDELHLLNICVKPKLQGQGYGRKILDYVIDFARQKSSVLVVLEVRRSNLRAQKLYLQTGFNEMSVRRNYYPAADGREDAILMGLDLGLGLQFCFSK